MIEGEKLEIDAEYTEPKKTGDPSREVKINKAGESEKFVAEKLAALQKETDEMVRMSDADLYDNFLRYDDITKFAKIDYTDLSDADKAGFQKKIDGFRFQANTSKRFIDDTLTHHIIGEGGTYAFDTNRAATCGLSMEQMLAAAYWACDDVANFRDNPGVELEQIKVLNRILLVKQVHDMRRGYDIDHGIDKPSEYKYPAAPDGDDNRCHGGSINSLAGALKSNHKAFNVKTIERQDLEREVSQIYAKIVAENMELIGKEENAELIRIWSMTGVVGGAIKELIQNEFDTKYKDEFEGNFKGYVADYTYFSIIDNSLKNLKIPKELEQKSGIETLSVDGLFDMICNNKLPLFIADKERGHLTSINYLSGIGGKGELAKELIAKLKTGDLKEPRYQKAALFLARSNLELAKTTELLKVKDKSIMLADVAYLSERELMVLDHGTLVVQGDANRGIVAQCIYGGMPNLLMLYATKVGLTKEEANSQYDSRKLTLLHFAVELNHLELTKLFIKEGADLNIQTTRGQSALMWAHKGNVAIVKALIDAGADLNLKDKNGDTALLRATEKGHTKIVELLTKKEAELEGKKQTHAEKLTDEQNTAPTHER